MELHLDFGKERLMDLHLECKRSSRFLWIPDQNPTTAIGEGQGKRSAQHISANTGMRSKFPLFKNGKERFAALSDGCL